MDCIDHKSQWNAVENWIFFCIVLVEVQNNESAPLEGGSDVGARRQRVEPSRCAAAAHGHRNGRPVERCERRHQHLVQVRAAHQTGRPVAEDTRIDGERLVDGRRQRGQRHSRLATLLVEILKVRLDRRQQPGAKHNGLIFLSKIWTVIAEILVVNQSRGERFHPFLKKNANKEKRKNIFVGF